MAQHGTKMKSGKNWREKLKTNWLHVLAQQEQYREIEIHRSSLINKTHVNEMEQRNNCSKLLIFNIYHPVWKGLGQRENVYKYVEKN